MTPEEKLDLIEDWHNTWGDIDLSELDPGSLWHELNDLLHPRPPLAVEGNVITGPWSGPGDDALSKHDDAPKKPLPGRWFE